MFNNNRYITCGIATTLPQEIIALLWTLIEELPAPADYLQVFSISYADDDNPHLTIVHSQEQPEYTKTWIVPFNEEINAKIFVIDDTTHSTMLLAEEY